MSKENKCSKSTASTPGGMDFSPFTFLLFQMTGLNAFHADKCRDLIRMALEGRDGSTEELSKLVNAPEQMVEKTVADLREMLAKQAEEKNMTLVELMDSLMGDNVANKK